MKFGKIRYIAAILLTATMLTESLGLESFAYENETISTEEESVQTEESSPYQTESEYSKEERDSECSTEPVTEISEEAETNSVETDTETMSESDTENETQTVTATPFSEEDSYVINTDLLLENSDNEISLEEFASNDSQFWNNQLGRIAGMNSEDDYFQGIFYFSAASEKSAKLIADIYNAELTGYANNIATVSIDGFTTEEVLKECAKINAELNGRAELPQIYADTKVSIATEEVEEEIDLEMAYGGYEDWFHEALGDYSAWNYSTGSGVRIAILDTGAGTHRDIKYAGRYNAFADDCMDMGNAMARKASYNNEVDNSGHGTAIAGVIAGKGGNNKESVIGVAPNAKLMSIKCMEKYGDQIYGDSATVIRAIYMAVELGCKVINVSFTDKAADGSLYEKAVTDAANAGVLVVCAAGNLASDEKLYPAACTNSLCIAATKKTDDGQVFDDSYSSYGESVSFAAPGSNIKCAAYGAKDAYSLEKGTSLSAAIASAAIALYLERNPELIRTTNTTVIDKVIAGLKKASTDLGDTGWDEKYGYGVINTAKLTSDSAFNVTAAPKFSIASGVIQSGVGIKIYSINGESTIYYTLDGTEPTKNSLKYSAERDVKGLIYLPDSVGQICLRAISIGPAATTSISQAVYTVIPSSIPIEGSAYSYAGELGRAGFLHNYAPIQSVSRGTDMPYQLFTMDLNGGDSVVISLKASGFNGELFLQCDDTLKTYDVRPIGSDKVDVKYERIIKYSNATQNKQKLKIAVSSGQLLPGQTLANGSGKYVLNVNVTRNISGLNLILPKTSLVKGTSMTATAVVTPTDAVNKKVSWKLTDQYGEEVNKAYAVVDVNGKITIKSDVNKSVQYTVRATSLADPNLYSEKKFTVYPVVTRMETLEDVVELISNGSNNTFDASANFAVTPGNGLGQYTYASTNVKVARVDENGLVTAVGPGFANITITASDGSKKKCTFRVNVTTNVNGITLTPSTKVSPVSTYYPISTDSVVRLDASVLPANASNKKLQYSISGITPKGVSIISNRIIVDKDAVAGDVFTVMATALDGSGKTASLRFKIYARPAEVVLSEERVKLNTINQKTITLKATVKDDKGKSNGVLQNVSWDSLDPKIATVSDSGVVTVVGKGRTKIRATVCDGSKIKKACIVDVVSGVTSIGISTAGSLQGASNAQPIVSGRKTALKAECTPANADNTNVIWELNKAPEGVTLYQGTINIPSNVKSGSVMVTARAADGFGATKTRTFNIYPDSVKKIVISSSASTLNTVTNKNCMVTAVTTPSATTFAGVLWFSSNEKIATVNSNGYVTAVGAGTVKITAVAKDGYGARSTIAINVVQPMTSFKVVSNKGMYTSDNKLLLTTGANVLSITNIAPAKVTDKNVSWKFVENVSGVTINEKNGRVTVDPDVANRITNLTVRVTVNSSGAYIDQPVAVYPKTTGVYLSAGDSSFKLAIGQTRSLKATVMPIHAYNSYAANPFSYSSSDTNVVTVSADGTVKAVGVGSARIIITATDGSKKRVIAKVKVI